MRSARSRLKGCQTKVLTSMAWTASGWDAAQATTSWLVKLGYAGRAVLHSRHHVTSKSLIGAPSIAIECR